LLNNRQSGRRRGRGRGPQGNGQRGNESRIDNRARGNAPQLLEKYKNMARDAQLSGDRVMTEYYLQFADHYFRIVAENRARFEEQRQPRRDEWQGDEGYEGEAGDPSGGRDADAAPADEFADGDRPRRDQRPRREFRREERDQGERRYANGNSYDAGEGESVAPVPGVPGAAIDAAILPPAIGVSTDPLPPIDEEEPAPRRRGRPRRSAEPGAEAAE
jgi:hypothetical protein